MIAERYRTFAATEARGLSPLYEELTAGVAGDPDLPAPAPPDHPAAFVLALDQRPVALTAPHGGWLRWVSWR